MTTVVPQKLLDGVVRALDPVEVLLFGSRARGDAREDSDIDLYVVVDDDFARRPDLKWRIAEARCSVRNAVDIVVTSATRHAERKHLVGTLAEVVSDEGLTVYARHA